MTTSLGRGIFHSGSSGAGHRREEVSYALLWRIHLADYPAGHDLQCGVVGSRTMLGAVESKARSHVRSGST